MNNIYIVSAHPNKDSLTASIVERVRAIARNLGFEAASCNLYDIGFDPVLSLQDMTNFRLENEEDSTDRHSQLVEQQNLVKSSDILIFVYPVWWGGKPAILKGWIDRVLSYGFAYSVVEGQPVGLLQEKKAIEICTHGQSQEEYSQNGMFSSMTTVANKGIFEFCGIETIGNLYYHDSTKDPSDVVQIDKILDFVENDVLKLL
ncbi:MAG: NAD(P)H-dependent oxidoreductase [Candidatus Kapaibacteriales bacterium]